MSKVSVVPPSGFRDFLPSEAAMRLSFIETITRTYLARGFQPIGLSAVENLETLQGKGGGADNEKLIFKLLKRGEDLERALQAGAKDLADAGLRFDLTLPLARYCARFRDQLPKPFKVFQIGPVWRADRPQKGRYREFYQCDVDIIGSREIGAEVDCIGAIHEAFTALGVRGVEVHLNDRRLLAALREPDFPEARWAEALVALDKLDKVGPEGVRREWEARFGRVPAGLDKAISGSPALEDFRGIHGESVGSLEAIVALLREAGVPAVFNASLVRGQDYYTGTIFELRHPKLAGAVGGGGRYNRLLEIFGSPDTPAFGGSIGFERLHLLLQEEGREAPDLLAPHVFFPLFDPALRGPVLGVAHALRGRGLRVDVFPDGAKLKSQFKYADDRKIPFVAILGGDEWRKKEIKVKDMASRTETAYSLEPLGTFAEQMEQLCRR